MNSKGLWRVAAAVLSGLVQVPALAAEGTGEGFSVTVGTKVWVNEWSSWYTPTIGGQAEVVPIDSSTKVSLIPVVSLRLRDFYASFSTLLTTSYTLSEQAENSIDASRKEFDANVGYYVLPGVGVSLGFKSLSQAFGGANYRWRGPTVGASVTAPIRGGVAAYVSVGVGFFTMDLPAADPNPPVNSGLNANYAIGEIGVAHPTTGISTVPVTSAPFPPGYRFPAVPTK